MHDGVHFEVESTFEALGKVYVVARILERGRDFRVDEGCRLGGLPVEPWVEQPRGVDVAGTARADVYSFCLRAPADRASLRIGDEVALWGPSVPPPTGAV
jgi:hypothetical protein